jgi:hypothetical protein
MQRLHARQARSCGQYLKHARDVTVTALIELVFVGFSDEHKGNVRPSVFIIVETRTLL